MEEKIEKLKTFFMETFCDTMFIDSILSRCYIDISVNNNITLSANKEGLICLIEQLISVLQAPFEGWHCHLDEASVVAKCDKPMIIQFIEEPLEKQ